MMSTHRRKPLFLVGEAVQDLPSGLSGEILSLLNGHALSDAKTHGYEYLVKIRNEIAKRREHSLVRIESATGQKRKVSKPKPSVQPVSLINRHDELVEILSGLKDGCLQCAHLEKTTRGRKTNCRLHLKS